MGNRSHQAACSTGDAVNAVAPGFIVSDMTTATARRLGRDFDDHIRVAAESIPVGRVGQPEDVAHAVSYFVSSGGGVCDRPGPLRSGWTSGMTVIGSSRACLARKDPEGGALRPSVSHSCGSAGQCG